MLIIFPFLYHCSLKGTIVPQVVIFKTSVLKKWITEKPSPPFIGYRVIVLPPQCPFPNLKTVAMRQGRKIDGNLKKCSNPKIQYEFWDYNPKTQYVFWDLRHFSTPFRSFYQYGSSFFESVFPQFICNSFLVFFLFESLLIWLQIRFHVYNSTSPLAKVRCVKNLGDKDFLSSLYLPFRYSANL